MFQIDEMPDLIEVASFILSSSLNRELFLFGKMCFCFM